MEYEKFVDLVKKAKVSTKHTGFEKIKLTSNRERTVQTIYKDVKCKTCGINRLLWIKIIFKKPQRLSIFQAELFWFLYVLKRKPMDYANYHKCPAGKEFIENIVDVEVRE